MLFSCLTIKILEGDGKIPFEEWFYLLTGGTGGEAETPNPAPDWLSNGAWNEFNRLDALSSGNFSGLRHSLEMLMIGRRFMM